ncbi:hypothetical protein H4I96_04936 [Botrytis cinerea]
MSKLYFPSNAYSTKCSVLIIPCSSRQYSRCGLRNCINHHTYHHSYYFEESLLSTQPIRRPRAICIPEPREYMVMEEFHSVRRWHAQL